LTYEKEYDIMGLKRIKISELTLSDNLKGLYTIGVKLINGVQTSVKVSLEHIQTAYENAVAATKKAETAANSANTAAGSANSAASSANNAATKANTAASNADKAREDLEEIKEAAVTATNSANSAASSANNAATKANTAAGNADTQADRAKEQADNPPKMGDNGNWWKWDEAQKKYVDTGVLAKGGVLYPTFSIDDDDMILYMEFEDEVSDKLIKFDEQTGELYLNVG
jgi:hypothetical protein